MIERCPFCGKSCLQCQCKVSPCHLPQEEELDEEAGEVFEVPEEESPEEIERRKKHEHKPEEEKQF